MEKLFVGLAIAGRLKEKGFSEPCLANYCELSYPINDSGNDYKKTICLFVDCESSHDEVKMLWIDNENANFHWHEGTYDNGQHSRCELVRDDIPAPTYQQVIDWFIKNHEMYIYFEPFPYEKRVAYHITFKDETGAWCDVSAKSLDEAINESLDFI